MKHTLAAAITLAFTARAVAKTSQPALPDVNRMSRNALEEEVTAARPLVQFRAVTPGGRPAGCVGPESRQFDFWLGEWDVSPSTNPELVIAESTISLLDQGCVILEEWRPFGSGGGHSINSWDAADGHWHQSWADASGRRTPYRGNFENGVMRFDNVGAPPPGAPTGSRHRMSFQALDANTVRQWGEYYSDSRSEWVVSWDLTYRRRPNTRP
jgi:hypothetical protein